MPVYKRAARPTAAFASDDPREPQTSDNDFTVLFQRPTERAERRAPYVPAAPAPSPGFAPRQVAPPRAAPTPPFPERPSRRPDRGDGLERTGIREKTTPLGMAVRARDRIEVVAVQPRPRDRAIRVVVFLALGCALGVGVELVMHRTLPESQADPLDLPSMGAAPAEANVGADGRPPLNEGASVTVANDKGAVAPPHHHHHGHHPPLAAPSAAAAATPAANAADAGVDVDDISAAIQTLTQAKEEVTIP